MRAVRERTTRTMSETRVKKKEDGTRCWFYFETWNRWAEVMWWELASDLSRSGPLPPSISMATEVRGYGRVGGEAEREGVVSNKGGGVRPHISSSLIRYERVGHVNWTVTYNTMADKERAVR